MSSFGASFTDDDEGDGHVTSRCASADLDVAAKSDSELLRQTRTTDKFDQPEYVSSSLLFVVIRVITTASSCRALVLS